MRYNKEVPNSGFKFPVTKDMINSLPSDCLLTSPIEEDHSWVLIEPRGMDIEPLYPGDPFFWPQFIEVIKQVSRSKNKELLRFNQTSHTVRERFKVNRYDQLAQLVRNDMPPDIITELSDYLLSNGCKFRNITNEGNYVNFTNGVVLLCRLLSWAIHFVSPTCFAHKYYWGVPRPEEVAGAIVRGELQITKSQRDEFNSLVSKTWQNEIKNDQRAFTMYQEGCPTHPSFPAMHSSSSAITLLLPIMLDVNEEHLQEIKTTMLNISFGRTMAGVHYPQDNYYGLELGERVLSLILPDKLASFGADKSEVMALISKYRTNWLKYI